MLIISIEEALLTNAWDILNITAEGQGFVALCTLVPKHLIERKRSKRPSMLLYFSLFPALEERASEMLSSWLWSQSELIIDFSRAQKAKQ